jgi:O-antigen/teichoic acid export membrane protein
VTGGAGASITYLLTRKREPLAALLPALGALLLIVTVLAWLGFALWSLLYDITTPIIVIAVVVPAVVVLSWQQSLYVAVGRLRNLNRQLVGLAAGTCAAIGVAVGFVGGDSGLALAVWAACLYVAAAVVVCQALRFKGGRARASPAQTLGTVVRYGSQSALNTVLGVLSYRIDALVLLAVLGTATFGVYSVAVMISELLLTISRPVTLAVVREIGVQALPESSAIAAKVMRICVAAVSVAAVVMFGVGPPLIEAVYGSQFQSATTVLRILLPGVVFYATASTFASFFLFQLGRPTIVTSINITMIAFQTMASLILVPKLGASGAAVACTTTYALGAALNTWRFCRATGLRIVDVWIIRPSDIRRVFTEWPAEPVGSPKT